MITEFEISQLKEGDRLIFITHGSVLQAKKGNVFTFSNWYIDEIFPDSKQWWQCKELIEMGNTEHNFHILDTEVFNESIHTDFVIMDAQKISDARKKFIDLYGE